MYRVLSLLLRLLCLGLAFSLQPGAVATAAETPPSVEKLKPGQFVWQPERAAEGPVEIVISLPHQIAYIFRSGELVGVSTVSSGRVGHESPIGRFQVLEKRRMHRSNRYDNAPMPFMQRLNWYGVALHAGEVTGKPASHGCIRLPLGFAKLLFGTTSVGSFVFITEEAVGSPEAALQLGRANQDMPLAPDRSPRISAQAAAP